MTGQRGSEPAVVSSTSSLCLFRRCDSTFILATFSATASLLNTVTSCEYPQIGHDAVNQMSFPFLFRVVEISDSHCLGIFLINGFLLIADIISWCFSGLDSRRALAKLSESEFILFMRQNLAKRASFLLHCRKHFMYSNLSINGIFHKTLQWLCKRLAMALQAKRLKKPVKGFFKKNEIFFRPTMLRAADSSKMTPAMPVLPSGCEGHDFPPPVVSGEPDCAPFAG